MLGPGRNVHRYGAAGEQRVERGHGQRHLSLHCLLPGEVALPRDGQLVDGYQAAGRRPPDAAVHDVQEADGHLDGRRVGMLEQALRPHRPGVVFAPVAVRLGIDAAEGPPALVLERRAPVRPEQVALVEDGVGDRPHGVHGTSSAAGRSESTVSSQVARALRDLYVHRRS